MRSRDRQFLDYYTRHRVDDQIGYYRSRAGWHGRKNERAIVYTGVLMFVAAFSSALLGAPWSLGPSWIWALLAAVVPAVSSAVAATRNLYEYERNRERFENTRLDLQEIQAGLAPSDRLPDEPFRAALANYVTQVEDLLSREHRQWVQLSEQAELRPPPEARPPGEPGE